MPDHVSSHGAVVHLGDYRSALAHLSIVDAILVDAPYSAKTHAGHDGQQSGDGSERRAVQYAAWSDADVWEFVLSWRDRCRGWIVTVTDDVLAPVWRRAFEGVGRYAFAPLPAVSRGSRVRLAGDGPSCWTWWVVVARPRNTEYARWGTLPGAYDVPPERDMGRVGGKPLSLMRALVRDYSRPGDLICDPCAGAGTTLRAAQVEGRQAVGAEIDAKAFRQAGACISAPYTPPLIGARARYVGASSTKTNDDQFCLKRLLDPNV